jgi:hypothetical protein
MSNRITKGKGLIGSLQTDNVLGLDLGSTTVKVRDYVKRIPITSAASTAEQDTGYDIPALARVRDITVLVQTASSAASTLQVGLLSSSSGGDADGFLNGVSTTGTGLKAGGQTTSTSGANGIFLVSNTYGVLLSTFTSGSTGTGTLGDCGLFVKKDHRSDSVTAKSITWTSNSTSTSLVADIFVHLTELTT